MMRFSVVFSYLPLAASLAAPLQQSAASTTTSTPVPQSTACGDVIGAADLGCKAAVVYCQALKLIRL
jgi:hypothetical protein